MGSTELPPAYIRRSDADALREQLDQVRQQIQQLGTEIGESGSTSMFSGESEVNVLRDEMTRLQRQEAHLHTMLGLPIVDDSTIDAIRELTRHDGVVRLGTTVVVEVEGDEERYTIVGSIEAKPTAGFISYDSPVGKALLGKRTGDEISVRAPRGGGHTVYRIVRVEA